MLEFGKPKRVITEPGLQYKIPFIQNVVFFDKRILDIDTASQEVIASDQKRLVVDAFARYKIVDPLLFFQSVAQRGRAPTRASAPCSNPRFGACSAPRALPPWCATSARQLMRTILGQVNKEAEPFGINVVDVRIKRVDLPEANMQAIYRRMQTERQRQAAEFRAEGEGASRRIRGTADREVTVIKADATGESERIRGNGDAEKNRIFAEAFGQDPDFFAFYRSMQAYEEALKPGDTRLLLSPDSEFFKYFNSSGGKAVGGTPSSPPPSPPDAQRACGRRPMARRRSRAQPQATPMPTERDISAGETPSPGPRLPGSTCGARSPRCRLRNERSCRRFGPRPRHRRVVLGALPPPRPQAAGSDRGDAGTEPAHGRGACRRGGRSGHLARARLVRCGRATESAQPLPISAMIGKRCGSFDRCHSAARNRVSLRRFCFMAAWIGLLFAGAPLFTTESLARGPDFVADVAEGLQDTVVNISTTQTLKGSADEHAERSRARRARRSRNSSTISSTTRRRTACRAR